MVTLPDRVQDLRCSCCLRRFGYANFAESIKHQAFCSDWCAIEATLFNEKLRERAEIWRMLYQLGMGASEIARRWGLDHANVYRTVTRSARLMQHH